MSRCSVSGARCPAYGEREGQAGHTHHDSNIMEIHHFFSYNLPEGKESDNLKLWASARLS